MHPSPALAPRLAFLMSKAATYTPAAPPPRPSSEFQKLSCISGLSGTNAASRCYNPTIELAMSSENHPVNDASSSGAASRCETEHLSGR